MLPYATNEDVIRICKELIAQGGGQPQPGPTPSGKAYDMEEVLHLLESFGGEEESPAAFEETYSLDGVSAVDLRNPWESLDAETAQRIMACIYGDEGAAGRFEIRYDLRCTYAEEAGFQSVPASFVVSIEVDGETGDARVVPYVSGVISDNSFTNPIGLVEDYIKDTYGTLFMKFTPAN